MQTNMLLHACGNGNATEKPRRSLAQRGAYRTATPAGRRLARTHACKSARARTINLVQARIHKTTRTAPLLLRTMPRLSQTPWSSRAAARANASQTKKAPRFTSEEPLVAFMKKKTASRRVRSRHCRQSPNRAYRPCRSNRNGWHSSTPDLHHPNTSQPGRRR